jgi:hypothetical protein
MISCVKINSPLNKTGRPVGNVVYKMKLSQRCSQLYAYSSVGTPDENIHQKVSRIERDLKIAIEEAKNVCKLIGNTVECVQAWDKVSDLSIAFYANKEREHEEIADPLKLFCDENPDADECREYDV